MFRKHDKMIASVAAVAAMTTALALTASAASTVPEIATSAAIPTVATVIDGSAMEGINWLHATGASAVSFASDLDDAKLVSADDMEVIDRNANTSMFVVKNGVAADVVFATDTTANDGTILLPYMHDRYFFLADVLTLIWACTAWRRIPQALLIQFASLSAYATYLRLRFTCPVRLGPYTFPMGLEALAILLALGLSIAALLALLPPAGGETQKRIGPKSLFNILKNASWREIF